MRPAYEASLGGGQHSPTPIYDSLYSEYRRAFRALPGDRSGEEDLGFTPFGTGEPRVPWEHAAAREPERRHRRRNAPRALPPGPRDNRSRDR